MKKSTMDRRKGHLSVFTYEFNGELGKRHLQCLIYFLGLAISYLNNVSVLAIFPAMIMESKNENRLQWKDFMTLRQLFLWSYLVMLIPFGHLTTIWSAKMILGIGMLINGLGGMLCPIVFDKGGWIYLCACRVIMGFGQASVLPCIYTLLSKWVPPNERGQFNSITYAGATFGTIVSFGPTEALMDATGWRGVTYVFGGVTVVWSLVFFFVGSNSPAASSRSIFFRISEAERRYIERSFGDVEEETMNGNRKRLAIPWKGILTSQPFWAILIVHCTNRWGFSMLKNYVFQFRGFSVQVDKNNRGLTFYLPYVTILLLAFPVGWISDWSVSKGISRGLLRKICNTIAHWGSGLALIGICFVPFGNTILPVVLLVITGGLSVGGMCGFQINHMDLSTNFSGLLIALTSTAASLVQLMVTYILRKIFPYTGDPLYGSTLFIISTGVLFLGNWFFIVFGSGETQWWNNGKHSRDNTMS